MTTIADGITSTQFLTALNANFADEKYNLTVTTLTSLHLLSDLNTNFTTIKNGRLTFIPSIFSLSGGSGAVFKNLLNTNFTNITVPMRDFSLLTKYAGNPTIVHGTYSFGTVDLISNAFVRNANKIGNAWYALLQTNVLTYFALVTSTDLINWTVGSKVIENTPGSWDDSFLVTPSVIKIGNLWYCYYSAHNGADLNQIGLTISSDFINWTKYGTDPVFLSSQDSNRNVGIPSVIKIGSTYYMYYCSQGAALDIRISYATSPDGLIWTYGGICLEYDSSVWSHTFIDPSVIENLNGIFEMVWCRSGLEATAQGVGYAISQDGIHWIKKPTQIMGLGTAGQFDDQQIGNPVLLEKDDGVTYLYYTGQSVGGTIADGGMAMI
jgi:predicted GH43/DUF377 family glycosyl hydrolase